jgi:hypothetical protein
MSADVLIGVQGSRLVLVIGRARPSTDDTDDAIGAEPLVNFLEIASQHEPGIGPGYLVLVH